MSSIPRGAGVYLINCIPTGKVYVGSSRTIHERWDEHQRLLRRGAHHSIYLQRAWDKYGERSFSYNVLEMAEADVLLEREQYWIDHYRACDNNYGFNLSAKAGAPMAGLKHSEETKKAFSDSRKGESNGNYKGHNQTCVICGNTFRESPKRPRKYCSQACYHSKQAQQERITPELRYKFGYASRGKKLSEEVVMKSAVSRMKRYIATDPCGDEYVIEGLAGFCRGMGLDQPEMSRVANGKKSQHKGWKIRQV